MEVFSGITGFWQTWAVDPLSSVLTVIHDAVGSYAIAIILFTIGIRLLMIPLTVRQIRSQRRMQMLQPEIAKMRKRLKGDRQAESKAMMELYRTHNVNPVSGCLPLLVQLPVLLALYGGILTLSSRGLLNEQFLWFNLAREDSTFSIVGQTAPTFPVDVQFATTSATTALESSIAADFTGQFSNYRFHLDTITAGQAPEMLADGMFDAVFTDDRLDLNQVPANVKESRLIQSAALVVARDRDVTRLTQNDVRRILRGELRSWAEVGVGSGTIALHGIRSDIGTIELLSELLLDGEPIGTNIQLHDSFDDYVDALRNDPQALGVASPLEHEDLRFLNIEGAGAARAFAPVPAALAAGTYPLAKDLYAYWPPPRDDAREFLRDWWDSGQGQTSSQVAGFTRLPADTGIFGSAGFYIAVLALLAGAFQFFQARMMQQPNAEGQAATMNRVMQFMPIIVVIFAWTFQAGLVLYWVISSIISIVQQYFTTGTGKLLPAHWRFARDVRANQPAAPAGTDGADTTEDQPEPSVAASPRRRRRRRRRRG